MILPKFLTCLDRSRGFEPLGLELGPGEVEGLGEQVEAPHVEQQLLHPPVGRSGNSMLLFQQMMENPRNLVFLNIYLVTLNELNKFKLAKAP